LGYLGYQKDKMIAASVQAHRGVYVR
jgi:hypothetical protein